MTGSRERGKRRFEMRLFDQQVIGVEGRDDEDADAGVGERRRQTRHHADHREGERPMNFQAAPIAITLHVVWHITLMTNQRKFVRRARDGVKVRG